MNNSICDKQCCLLLRGWSIRGVAMYAIGAGFLLPGIAARAADSGAPDAIAMQFIALADTDVGDSGTACDPANEPANDPVNDPTTGPGGGHGGGHGNGH
ncbi:hypothetical protein ACFPTO_07820 [Paraburkholderia denitrificans]|uniref:Uncharacterized protein n=1 Tax=Paraburkholderia denitrificans TaxID=694025 RepID=A0ABW0J6N6_9BURK